MVFAAGQRLTAQLLNDAFGAVESDTQNALANVSATSYTETFTTSNTPASRVFTAPTSGMVIVHNSAWLDNSSALARTYLGWVLRTGGTLGAGTTVLAADDHRAIHNLSTDDITAGRAYLVTGLTAGNSYNIRQAGRVTSGTGEFQDRHLIVQPVIA